MAYSLETNIVDVTSPPGEVYEVLNKVLQHVPRDVEVHDFGATQAPLHLSKVSEQALLLPDILGDLTRFLKPSGSLDLILDISSDDVKQAYESHDLTKNELPEKMSLFLLRIIYQEPDTPFELATLTVSGYYGREDVEDIVHKAAFNLWLRGYAIELARAGIPVLLPKGE